MQFDQDKYAKVFKEYVKDNRIVKSDQSYKIRLFISKSENSLVIAKYHKDINPDKDLPQKIHWNYWAITISYYSMLYATKAAILTKGYEVKDHMAAQIALGHLFVPDEIEKDDLELLNQAYKIFEDEYIKYFEDARKESHVARYSAIKTYTERRVEEIYENAREFILKIKTILE